jgi:hypothetical protein
MIRLLFSFGFAVFLVLLVPTLIWSQNANRIGGSRGLKLFGYMVTASDLGMKTLQGVHPLRVTIETFPPVASLSDQKFSVVVNTNYPMECSTTATIEIPTGSKSGAVELLLPASGPLQNWSSIKVTALTRISPTIPPGRPILLDQLNYQGLQNRSFSSSLLWISSAAPIQPDQTWVQILNEDNFNSMVSTEIPQTQKIKDFEKVLIEKGEILFDGRNFSVVCPGALPENWIGLTGVDQIIISMSDYRLVCQNNKLQRANLEKWVAAGGALIIFGSGPKYRETDEILSLFFDQNASTISASGDFRWGVPVLNQLKPGELAVCSVRTKSFGSYRASNSGRKVQPFETELKVNKVDHPSLLDETKFGFLSYLNGCILSVDDDMTNWSTDDWRQLENCIVLNGSSIHARLGLWPGGRQKLSIPGVGEPPILLFKILITLFLGIAGPVALIILSRIGKLQLLLVVIPVLSGCVCISLFAFVLISDGFDKSARVQSATSLDQRTNLAVINSRAAYFSNFSTREYVFPEDTFVGLANYKNDLDRNVNQTGGSLRVSGKALGARTLHEITTFYCRSVSEQLIFMKGGGSEGTLPVAQNLLGAKVLFAIFRDDQDDYYLCKSLDNGLTKSLTKIRLEVDWGFSDFADVLSANESETKNWNVAKDLCYGHDETVLELLRRSRVGDLLSRPNSYVALLEEFPLVTDALEKVQYKKQAHVVLGKW